MLFVARMCGPDVRLVCRWLYKHILYIHRLQKIVFFDVDSVYRIFSIFYHL